MRGSAHAAAAAATTADGVGKSGSPAPKLITSSPAWRSALALESIARVADAGTAATRADTRRERLRKEVAAVLPVEAFMPAMLAQ